MKVIHINCPFGYTKEVLSIIKPLFKKEKVDYYLPELLGTMLQESHFKEKSITELALYSAFKKDAINSFLKENYNYFIIIGPITKQINIDYSISIFPNLIEGQYCILNEKIEMGLFMNPSDSDIIVYDYTSLVEEILKCLTWLKPKSKLS